MGERRPALAIMENQNMEPVPDPAWLARILANAQRAMETSGTAANELAELTATALKDSAMVYAFCTFCPMEANDPEVPRPH